MILLRFTYCFPLEFFSFGVIEFLFLLSLEVFMFALIKYFFSKVVVFKEVFLLCSLTPVSQNAVYSAVTQAAWFRFYSVC